ncbi:hypothetical protein Tco_0463091 [Tanacetum coccineum]
MILDQSFAQLYDDDVVSLCCLGILQLVILGVESRRAVPDWMLRLANDRVAWNKYPWGSYVWPTLYSQLRNANVKRWSPLYVAEPTNEDDAKTYSIFGYTWAFKTWILESFRVTAIRYFDRYNRYPRVAAWSKKKGRFLGHMVIPFFQGNMPAARLTPDDNEARSDWWISSKAYFDGFIGQVERVPFDLSRQNMYEIPSDIYREFDEQKREIERNKKEVDNIKEEMRKFRQEMNVQPVRQENKEPIIVEKHYGLSDFSQFQSMQGGPSSFQGHMSAQSATQNWQPGISSQPGSYYSFGQVPSHMGRPNLQTTIETHHDVDGIFDQINKPVVRGNTPQFSEKVRNTRVKVFYSVRSRVLRGKDIQQDILSEYKIHISYQQAMKGKHYGTITRIKTDDNGVFEMLFIAIGASIRTFLNYLRPMLMIDAAHQDSYIPQLSTPHAYDRCCAFKGLYKGTNLVVVAMDGNNQIVPIAFAISDRHAANMLWQFNITEFPLAFQAVCLSHLNDEA